MVGVKRGTKTRRHTRSLVVVIVKMLATEER